MPAISVIIPVFNGEKTLTETIQSVLNQSFKYFELIIINSSSTDLTTDIIARFEDSRLMVFTYPKAGVAVNRNRGFTHACGNFITFLDADDLWTPDKLEAQCKALEKNSQAAVAYSWTNCIDETGKFLRKCSYVTWSGDVYPQLLLDDFIGSGSNVMIRREAFADVGGFDESLSNGQDTDLWLRLAAHYHFVVVPSPQILYRISSQSMSSNVLGLEASNLQIIERSFAEAPESLQYLKPHSIANLYKYLTYKALDAPPGQQKTLTTARFIWQAIKTDPSLLRTPIIYKALLKLGVMAFLDPHQAKLIFTKFPRLSNTSTFLGYEKVDLSLIKHHS